jgi:hypothetical protein
MGMNELYQQLKQFITELHSFNTAVKTDWDRLEAAWERVDRVWQVQGDDTRKQFDGQWREMAEAMNRYREQSGDRYEQFLNRRKQTLDRYFNTR